MRWDPKLYEQFAAQRSRPFYDLLAWIDALEPRTVVDLGCGTGNLTSMLPQHWPSADVLGIDSSTEMIARTAPAERLRYEIGDVQDWRGSADVVLSNAALHWLPEHLDLLRRWSADVPDDGWLAFQVPANFESPSYVAINDLAREWGADDGVLRPKTVAAPSEYAELLVECGLVANVWETTYQHLLPGEDAVLNWLRGTSLRGVLGRMSDEDATQFCAELAPRLREAYRPGRDGTWFAFRRIFAVGHRVDS